MVIVIGGSKVAPAGPRSYAAIIFLLPGLTGGEDGVLQVRILRDYPVYPAQCAGGTSIMPTSSSDLTEMAKDVLPYRQAAGYLPVPDKNPNYGYRWGGEGVGLSADPPPCPPPPGPDDDFPTDKSNLITDPLCQAAVCWALVPLTRKVITAPSSISPVTSSFLGPEMLSLP
jgi:hypothetical protein